MFHILDPLDHICCFMPQEEALRKKVTIHQVTTMVTTSENVLFPGHNYLLTNGTVMTLHSLVLAANNQYLEILPK